MIAVGTDPWSWHPHMTVWLMLGGAAVGYALALRFRARLGGRGRAVRPAQVTAFALGLLTLFVAADWPMHDLAERSLYSIHMVQHLLISLVAPPLLLLGTPDWLARSVARPMWGVVSRLSRPLVALLVFNAVMVITHWPALVDATLHSEPEHFAAHLVLFSAAMFMWMPVVGPLPELVRLSPPARCVYLFLQSIIPTVPASFLTFTSHPIYRFYAHVPRLWGLGATEDQRISGLIMKLGGGMLLWAAITVIFFLWSAEEDRREHNRLPTFDRPTVRARER